MKKILFISLFLIFIFLGSVIYKKINIYPENNIDQPLYVQTIVAESKIVPEVYKTIATVTAKNDVKLFYESSNVGRVDKILKSAGSNVKQGDLLIKLLPEFYIKAPINGIVTKWLVSTGEFIQKGKEVGRIIDNTELEAEYFVAEYFADKLSLGQQVLFKFRTFDNEKFSGKVDYVSPFSDPNRHSILVRANLENNNKKILSGLFTEIEHIFKYSNSIIIPESCVLYELDGNYVFKIVNNNAIKTKIIVGIKEKSMVEIKSGINKDDVIVLTMHPGLIDGKDVIFKNLTGDL